MDCRTALLTLLDQVDYTAGNCRPNEMVGAVLPREVIRICREAAQQSVQSDGAEALQFCEICQSWHGKQHITTRDVSPRR